MPTLHSHLNEVLRERISVMSDGERFPTEAELCAEFMVSRMTVSKVLGEFAGEGLLERRPRRGTFVRKSPALRLGGAAEWLRDNYFGGMMSELPTRTLRLNVYEYRHDFIRPMWDRLLAEWKLAFPDMIVEIDVDPERAAAADLIWASNRRDMATPSHEAFSQEPAARAALARCCFPADYFPAAWNFLQGEKRAGCPFAMGTAINLWNMKELEAFGGQERMKHPATVYDFSCRSPLQDGSPRPLTLGFLSIPFMLMELVSAGLIHYDGQRGFSGFHRSELGEYLAYQRRMCQTARQAAGDRPVTDIHDGVTLFLSGQIVALSTFSPTLKVIPENRLRDFSVSSFRLGELAPAVPVYMGIGTHCRDVSAAAAAIAFFCGRPGQRILAQYHNNIPARLEDARDKDYLARSPHQMAAVIALLQEARGVVDLKCFTTEAQFVCGRISRYILGEIEWPEVVSDCNP